MTINEVNLGKNQFIELYFTTNITVNNWDLCYLNSNDYEVCSSLSGGFPTDGNYISGDFSTFDLRSDMDKKSGEILLKDQSGKAIDALRYCNGNRCTSKLWNFDNRCSTVFPKHSPGQTVLFRIPDGHGSFEDNNTTTKGCSNNGCGDSGGGSDTPAADFNCVEFGESAANGHLFTKTTGQPFQLEIVALKNDATQEATFASTEEHDVIVELVDGNSGDGSCSGFAPLSPPHSQSLRFSASDSGRLISSPFNVNKPYKSVWCKVTDNTSSPAVVGCSSDNFAIRPLSLQISSNITYDSSSDSPRPKAGLEFTLFATASAGYDGIPVIDNNKLTAHANADRPGILGGSFSITDGLNGISSGTNFTYSEVGLFQIAAEGIYDHTFTAVDQPYDCLNNFNNTVDSSGKIGCKFGNTNTTDWFGRFTPHHFDVSLNSPAFQAACDSFSYVGQPLRYATIPVATVTAKNAAGAPTLNYQDTYWKIDPNNITYSILPSYNEATTAITTLLPDPPMAIANGNGVGQLRFGDTRTDIINLIRNTPTAPFNAEIALQFNLSDSDGIEVANVDGAPKSNPISFGAAASGSGIAINGGKSFRWGRLTLSGVNGSELMPLNIPVTSQYFNGSNFVQNNADNCTSLNLADHFSISDPADLNCTLTSQNSPVTVGSGSVKATLANTSLISGATLLTLSADSDTSMGPGAGNTGSVEITSSLTNVPWLQYDWDVNTVHDNCPGARATFGIYKGNSKQIYFREVY